MRREPHPLFVFSPQGGQWPGMVRGLLEKEKSFGKAFARCDELVRQELGWSLAEALSTRDASDRFVQPTVTALQIALVELWRGWGVQPAAVAGMSLGEVAAAYAASAVGIEDAMRVACAISRLGDRSGTAGGMMVVRLASDEVQRRLGIGGQGVWLAAELSIHMTVVAGDRASLEALAREWKRDGATVYPVSVGAAYHGEAMEGARAEFLGSLEALKPAAERAPFYSSVTAGRVSGGELGGAHWWRLVSLPARFVTLARALLPRYRTFLEIGPNPILLGTLSELVHETTFDAALFPSLIRDQDPSSVLLASRRALADREEAGLGA